MSDTDTALQKQHISQGHAIMQQKDPQDHLTYAEAKSQNVAANAVCRQESCDM